MMALQFLQIVCLNICSMEKITIIDTKVANLESVCSALDYLSANYEIAVNPNEIANARRLILPGVGNFGRAILVRNR